MSITSYLHEVNLLEFCKWYSRISIYSTCQEQLDNLTDLLHDAYKSKNNEKEITLKENIKYLLETNFRLYYLQSPKSIWNTWLDKITPFCFQGGYGHSISYNNSPHHWCIKPEYYQEIISGIPNELYIAAVLLDMYLVIEPFPAMEKWSG